MGLLDALKQYVADAMPGGLLNPEFNNTNGQRLAAELQRGLLESSGINARDKRRVWNKNQLDAVTGSSDTRGSIDNQAYETAMNMAGMAPMGMIKTVGRMPKKGILPDGVTTDMLSSAPSDMFGTGMAGTIKQLTNGDYLGRYLPTWGGEGKPFYAVGDNAPELKQFMLDRMTRSESGTVGAKAAAFNKSTIGQLQKLGFDANDFKQARSTQSSSEYLTHIPSGTKIRISDHDLPLHYEQPDVDLRSWMTDQEKINAIKKALE